MDYAVTMQDHGVCSRAAIAIRKLVGEQILAMFSMDISRSNDGGYCYYLC